MSSGSQAVPSRPTCRSSNRRAFTWRSISRRRHCSVFLCRTCSSLGPTRCANEASCVHHAARRRGGGVAVCGACAAGPPAGGRGIAAYSEARRSVRQTIPIVGMADDMVGSGLAASMARPGGNTTGVSILSPELDVKRLEILHEFVPQARRIAVIALLRRSAAQLFSANQPREFSAKTRRSVAEGSGGPRTSSFHQHAHQIAFLHDHVLDAVELDFGPRPLAE